MVTPAGLPSWTRTASADIYGGRSDKRDLGGIGAVNAKTDVTAAEIIRVASDLARCVQTAPLLWARVLVTYAAGTATATVQECSTQWAGPSGSYAGATPPTGQWPTVATGTVTTTLDVTFPALLDGTTLSANDDYGTAGTFNLDRAQVAGHTVTLDANRVSLNIAGCTTNNEVLFLVVY